MGTPMAAMRVMILSVLTLEDALYTVREWVASGNE